MHFFEISNKLLAGHIQLFCNMVGADIHFCEFFLSYPLIKGFSKLLKNFFFSFGIGGVITLNWQFSISKSGKCILKRLRN